MGIGEAVGIAPQGCVFVGVGPLLRVPRLHTRRIVALLGEQGLCLGRCPWGTRPEHDTIAGARAGCQHAVICGALDYAERCGQCPANLDVTTRSWHVLTAQRRLDNSA
jgi:hypothetical protein